MPKYVIEREMPGAGNVTEEELREGAIKSCDVIRQLGGQVQWQQSYLTQDKIYCVYIAPNEELVRRHAEMSGFPATRITKVISVIDPATAEITSTAKAA